MTKCVVLGCDTTKGKGISLHKFPNPVKEMDRFRTWVSACGNSKLFKEDPFSVSRMSVCRKHFALHPLLCVIQKDAVPTLHLPESVRVSPGWLSKAAVDSGICLPEGNPESSSSIFGISYSMTEVSSGSPRRRITPRRLQSIPARASVPKDGILHAEKLLFGPAHSSLYQRPIAIDITPIEYTISQAQLIAPVEPKETCAIVPIETPSTSVTPLNRTRRCSQSAKLRSVQRKLRYTIKKVNKLQKLTKQANLIDTLHPIAKQFSIWFY